MYLWFAEMFIANIYLGNSVYCLLCITVIILSYFMRIIVIFAKVPLYSTFELNRKMKMLLDCHLVFSLPVYTLNSGTCGKIK